MNEDDNTMVTLTLNRTDATYALAAPAMRRALEDTDEMLRREVKYGTDETRVAIAEKLRQDFQSICRDQGVYLWDDGATIVVPAPSWWNRLLRRLS